MSAKKTKKKNRRRRRRATTIVVLLFIIVGVVLSMTVFFRVDNIEVRGSLMQYTKQEIVKASGITEGMNLFRFSAKDREKEIWSKLPYIETVEIRRSLPGTVIIEVTESTGLLAVRYSGGCVVMSPSLKILEITSVPPVGAIEVTGLVPDDPASGSQLETEQTENAEFLKTLVSVLDIYDLLDKVTLIDVSDKLNYSLVYDDRFFVMIGTANNADYKINMLSEVVLHKLSETDTGYIDISTAGKAIYKRGALAQDEDPPEEQEPEEEVVFVDEDVENAQNNDD